MSKSLGIILFSVLITSCVESCFIPTSRVVHVPQTLPPGFQITKVEAVDCDPESLRLSSTDPSFTVQSNGVIVSVSPVSVTGERTFSVRVQDNNGVGSEMEVRLLCEKANQEEQVILKRVKRRWGPGPFHIMENSEGPFPKYIDTIVSDAAVNYSLYYSLSGEGVTFPPGLFTIVPETGDLKVHQTLDREERASYIVTVEALDRFTFQQRDLPMQVEILVDDVNDNAPQFAGSLQFIVPEQSSIGTEVGTISATDIDDPKTDHSKVRYKLLSGSETFFTINPQLGVITTATNSLDRETKHEYTMIVEARDLLGEPDGLFSTATATITVGDINDNPPTFKTKAFKATVAENEGEKLLLRIPVDDKDLINTPNWVSKFVITKGNEKGNFRIETDPKTNEGLLYVAKPLDYEQNSNVKLEISARNVADLTGTTAQWESVPVDVTITDIDEGPEFSAPTIRFPIKENTPNGTVIGTYSAIDPETKKSDGIMYYKSSDPGRWVNMNKNTGELTVANTIDSESPLVQDKMYNISVRAVDATGKVGTGTVILEIEDENDNQPTIPPQMVMCEDKASVVVMAEDKDQSPYSSPFIFRLPPEHSEEWSVERLNDTAAVLKPKKTLDRGVYDVSVDVKDLQGFGGPQPTTVTICQCRNGVCLAKDRSVTLGPLGILALLLPLLLLLLFGLLFLCLSVGKPEKLKIDDTEFSNGHLLPSNTEAPGEEVDSYILNQTVIDQGLKGSVKGSMLNVGLQGNRSYSTMDGYGTLGMGFKQNYSSGQFEQYGSQLIENKLTGSQLIGNQLVRSQVLGNGMDSLRYTQDSSLHETWQTNNLLLQRKLEDMYMKEDNINMNALHCYEYEGQGSEAGSVGCCSILNDDSDNLDFLNTLGPKFKTLAEACKKS